MDALDVLAVGVAQQERMAALRERIAEATEWYSAGPEMLAEAVATATRKALDANEEATNQVHLFRAGAGVDAETLEGIKVVVTALAREASSYTSLLMSIESFAASAVFADESRAHEATLKVVEVLRQL